MQGESCHRDNSFLSGFFLIYFNGIWGQFLVSGQFFLRDNFCSANNLDIERIIAQKKMISGTIFHPRQIFSRDTLDNYSELGQFFN